MLLYLQTWKKKLEENVCTWKVGISGELNLSANALQMLLVLHVLQIQDSLVNFTEGLLVDINALLLGLRDDLPPSEGQGEIAVSLIVTRGPSVPSSFLKLGEKKEKN